LEKSDSIWQVWIRKTNYPEPLLTRRNPETDIKTRGVYKPWDINLQVIWLLCR
jgi:hypothetical protein